MYMRMYMTCISIPRHTHTRAHTHTHARARAHTSTHGHAHTLKYQKVQRLGSEADAMMAEASKAVLKLFRNGAVFDPPLGLMV